MNVVDVEVASQQALEEIRQGQGPQFLECRCYRFKGHSMFDTQLYREKSEVEQWLSQGPVVQLVQWLEENYSLSAEQVAEFKKQINTEIDAAVIAAEQGEFEALDNLLNDVYTEVGND